MLNFTNNTELSFSYTPTKFNKILLGKVDSTYIIVLRVNAQEYFVKIPKTVSFITQSTSSLLFFVKNKKNILDLLLLKNLLNNLNNVKTLYKKKLELNGLGFRFLKIDDNVELKLGYSHLVNLKKPKEITRIAVRKKRITLESIDKIKLGNFANLMYSSRKYNSYKGKGFSFLNVKKRIKEIKKK